MNEHIVLYLNSSSSDFDITRSGKGKVAKIGGRQSRYAEQLVRYRPEADISQPGLSRLRRGRKISKLKAYPNLFGDDFFGLLHDAAIDQLCVNQCVSS